MENTTVLCTTCGGSDARYCIQCRSAAYCTTECQQTDWRTHRLLCRRFADVAKDDFSSRPSTEHYLAITFPMADTRPKLIWVGSRRDENEKEDYFHPILDHHLHIPGDQSYINRGLRQVTGNIVRGRERNKNTLDIWFLDPDITPFNITTNQTIHGTLPTLIADTWGEFIWKGPIVAVMKCGIGWDPRRLTDINLTAYRDAIDYLGFYMDTIGSMIDPNTQTHQAKFVLKGKVPKVMGVRINCLRDQFVRGEPEMVQVSVPGMHPLFNLESDDPCEIPSLLDRELVVKAYDNVTSSGTGDDDLRNPLTKLLRLSTATKDGKWVYERHWRESLGSFLIADRFQRDIDIEEVTALCDITKDVAVPFMASNDASRPNAREELERHIRKEGARRLHV
ncbi:hypothetical protein S40293_11483 [Stachybotrys chartarum IBT 40293]|nr:hypothetical protein S40293_11483 [Stachybotrys chartarum IBT 40293]